MIQDNNAFYNSIEQISQELEIAGQHQWATSLREALSISTLPSEILGEARLQLRRLRTSNVSATLGFMGRIDEAIRYLNRVLDK
jgi:hypothetical protein